MYVSIWTVRVKERDAENPRVLSYVLVSICPARLLQAKRRRVPADRMRARKDKMTDRYTSEYEALALQTSPTCGSPITDPFPLCALAAPARARPCLYGEGAAAGWLRRLGTPTLYAHNRARQSALVHVLILRALLTRTHVRCWLNRTPRRTAAASRKDTNPGVATSPVISCISILLHQ